MSRWDDGRIAIVVKVRQLGRCGCASVRGDYVMCHLRGQGQLSSCNRNYGSTKAYVFHKRPGFPFGKLRDDVLPFLQADLSQLC